MEKVMKKVLHIRLTTDLGLDDIKRIMGEAKYDGRVKKAALWGKLRCFLARLFMSILNITLGPLFIYGFILKSGDLDFLVLILFGLIALFLLRWILPGILQFISLWVLLILPLKRRDILNIAECFHDELDAFPVDWERMRILCAPYVANGIPMKEFKKAWKVYTGTGNEKRISPPEWMSEKLEQALRDVRQTIACSRCGEETETHRTALPWQFRTGETPSALNECPQCKAAYCGKCRSEMTSRKCPQCGGSIQGQPEHMYFEEHPTIWLERNSNKVTKDLKPVLVVEDIGNVCKKLELRWSASVRFDAPSAWSTKGKADGERPKGSNAFPCVIHMENYGVKFGEKWYLAQALPPDDCTTEWEEIPIEEKKET